MADEFRVVQKFFGRGPLKHAEYRLEVMWSNTFHWSVMVPWRHSLIELARTSEVFFKIDISTLPIIKEK